MDLRDIVSLLSLLEGHIGQPIKPLVQSKGLSPILDYAALVRQAVDLGVPKEAILASFSEAFSQPTPAVPAPAPVSSPAPIAPPVSSPAPITPAPKSISKITDPATTYRFHLRKDSAPTPAPKVEPFNFRECVLNLMKHEKTELVKLSTREVCLLLGLNPKSYTKKVYTLLSELDTTPETGCDPNRYTRGRVSVFTMPSISDEQGWTYLMGRVDKFAGENPPMKADGLVLPMSFMDFLDGTDDDWVLRDESGEIITLHITQKVIEKYTKEVRALTLALLGYEVQGNSLSTERLFLDRFILERAMANAFPAKTLQQIASSQGIEPEKVGEAVEHIRSKMRATQASPDVFNSKSFALDTHYAGRVYLIAVMYAYYYANS